jgi:dihydrofolate reductase
MAFVAARARQQLVVPNLNVIVACAENGVIGQRGKLPWRIPEDTTFFLDRVRGGVAVHGRRVWEEIGRKPVPGCHHSVVLSRAKSLARPDAQSAGGGPGPADVSLAASVEEALRTAQLRAGAERQIWVCGGEDIYRRILPLANRLFLTTVHRDFEGDTMFAADWRQHFTREVWRREGEQDCGLRFTFREFARS